MAKKKKMEKNDIVPANQEIVRDEKGRFVKGVCPHKGGGRPAMPAEIREMCRANSPKAIQTAIDIMQDNKKQPKDRLKACEILLNRAYGLPSQVIEGSEDGKPVKLSVEAIVGLLVGKKEE